MARKMSTQYIKVDFCKKDIPFNLYLKMQRLINIHRNGGLAQSQNRYIDRSYIIFIITCDKYYL